MPSSLVSMTETTHTPDRALAVAVLSGALDDYAATNPKRRRQAEHFLFGQHPEEVFIREHWLQLAGIAPDGLKRLAGLNRAAMVERLRAAQKNNNTRRAA